MTKRIPSLACAVVVVVSSVGFAQEPLKIDVKYGQTVSVPPQVLEGIDAKRHIPSYITKTAQGLKIDKKHKRLFAYIANQAIVIPLNLATPENAPNYQTYFDLYKHEVKRDKSMFITYCSCGDRYEFTEGDNCMISLVGNNELLCSGSCTGQENQGESCTYTMVHYGPPNSGVTPRARGRGTSLPRP